MAGWPPTGMKIRAAPGKTPMETEELAEFAKKRLRAKIAQLIEALQGHQLNDHRRWLIDQSIEHAKLLDQQVEALEEKIEQHLEPYRQQYELLQTILVSKQTGAANILAEIGPHIERSAGKSKQSHQEDQQVSIGSSGGSGLRCGAETELGVSAKVLPLAELAGKEKGHHRDLSQSPASGLVCTEPQPALRGTRCHGFANPLEGKAGAPPSAPVAPTGSRREDDRGSAGEATGSGTRRARRRACRLGR